MVPECTTNKQSFWYEVLVAVSDVKRGQNVQAETESEARVLRPRSRPEL